MSETKRSDYECLLAAFLEDIESGPGWPNMLNGILSLLERFRLHEGDFCITIADGLTIKWRNPQGLDDDFKEKEEKKYSEGEWNNPYIIINLSFENERERYPGLERYDVKIIVVKKDDCRKAKVRVRVDNDQTGSTDIATAVFKQENELWHIDREKEERLDFSLNFVQKGFNGSKILFFTIDIFDLPENYFHQAVQMINIGLSEVYNRIVPESESGSGNTVG